MARAGAGLPELALQDYFALTAGMGAVCRPGGAPQLALDWFKGEG
jgi:hypothetical protein